MGTKSNRSAIGARVVLTAAGKTQTKELMSQSSFLCSNDPRLHFGLGSSEKVELRIRWPNGDWQTLTDIAADQLVSVKEGSGIVPNARWKKS